MSRHADLVRRLQEAALAYADAEDEGAHERGWMRLRFAAIAYAQGDKKVGRPALAADGGEGRGTP